MTNPGSLHPCFPSHGWSWLWAAWAVLSEQNGLRLLWTSSSPLSTGTPAARANLSPPCLLSLLFSKMTPTKQHKSECAAQKTQWGRGQRTIGLLPRTWPHPLTIPHSYKPVVTLVPHSFVSYYSPRGSRSSLCFPH